MSSCGFCSPGFFPTLFVLLTRMDSIGGYARVDTWFPLPAYEMGCEDNSSIHTDVSCCIWTICQTASRRFSSRFSPCLQTHAHGLSKRCDEDLVCKWIYDPLADPQYCSTRSCKRVFSQYYGPNRKS